MKTDEIYQSVTDRLIEAIEAGTVPWRMPWVGGGPVNVRTNKPYRGVNIFLLSLSPYADPRWGTYRACKEAAVIHARSQGRKIIEKESLKNAKKYYLEEIDGKEVAFEGGVTRGEKSTWIILWKKASRKEVNDEGEVEDRSYGLLRMYPVFNAEQCVGLPPRILRESDLEPIDRAEEIVKGYIGGPGVLFGGGVAGYEPSKDLVRMPEMENFKAIEGYYSTFYHELIHSTGHESRLDRLETTIFGTDPYAREELVAEMGAAMLCGVAGIDNLDQSASYINGWAQRLRDDPKLVIKAGGQAQRGADLILGTTFEDETSDEKEAVAA